MLIVGLTGGIATGKSTVSHRLRERYKFPVVDADVIAREVVAPSRPAYNSIVQYFSELTPDLLLENGSLNRAALGRTIFGNDKYRKILNAIVHPAVRKSMALHVLKTWLSGHAVVFLDVPLLFESKLDRFCGATVVVACDDSRQYERLRKRDSDLSAEDAQQRIASQMPVRKKASLATYVIDNNGDLEHLYRNMDVTVRKLIPSTLRTLLEWIPPIGLFMALLCYLRNVKII